MKMRLLLLMFIFTVIAFVRVFSQTDVLIVSYKPLQAKEGKDGNHRFGMRLFRMAKSGKDAKDGENAVDLKIKIYALLQGNSTRLKLVCFVNNTLRDSFFINPVNQQIKFLADGGDGGKGGSGETGLPQEGNKAATAEEEVVKAAKEVKEATLKCILIRLQLLLSNVNACYIPMMVEKVEKVVMVVMLELVIQPIRKPAEEARENMVLMERSDHLS